MEKMQIPGTNKYVYDGSIIILEQYKDLRWIVHYGIYVIGADTYSGWYVAKIPTNDILPLAQSDLEGCEIIYTPTGFPDTEPPCPPAEIVIDTARLKITERLEVEGDTRLSGYITADDNRITNVGAPEADTDAATKQYVDAKFSELLNLLQSNSSSNSLEVEQPDESGV